MEINDRIIENRDAKDGKVIENGVTNNIVIGSLAFGALGLYIICRIVGMEPYMV